MRKLLGLLFLLCTVGLAHGQSSPNLYQGQVPSAAQWNSYFAAKQDLLRYTPLNSAGGVMSGELVTAASSATGSGFNIPQGIAPNAPNNGDIWATAAGLFVQIAGQTIGPLGSGGGGGGGTSMADNTGFTQGPTSGTSFTPIGCLFDPTSSITSLTAGNAGVARCSAERFFLTSFGLPMSTGNLWNSGTTLNNTQTILGGNSAQAESLVQLDQSNGTFSAGQVTFEGSYDGTSWVTLASDQVIDPTSASGATIANPYTFVTNTNKAFLLLTRGFQQVRMRLSTAITGSGTVTPYITDIPYLTGPFKTTVLDGAGNTIGSTGGGLNVAPLNDMTGTVPGTAPGYTGIVGGIYNSSAPNASTGQTLPFQTDVNGNLKVNVAVGGGTGGTSSSFASTFPSVGTAIGVKNGSNMVNLTADGSGNLDVNCTVGCAGGSFNNNSDAVATSSTNGQAAAWLYGFNGSTWDRLRDDTNKYLYTDLGAVGGTTLSLGQTTMSASIPVAIASNQSAIPASQSGNWVARVEGNSGSVVDASISPATAPSNMFAVGGIYNTSGLTPSNGQSAALQLDQAGNLREAPGAVLSSFSAWSSGTSLNTANVIYNNSGASAVLVQIDQSSGTFSAGQITFDVSYDQTTTWTSVLPADMVVDPTSATLAQISLPYTLVTSTNKPFLILTHGANALRIRLSTAINGTGTVTTYYSLLPNNRFEEVVALSPSPGNFNVNLGQYGGNSVVTGGANGSVGVGGLAASGASVSGNPLLHGGRAQNAEQTAVSNGQAVDAAFDLVGKQIVMPYANKENFLNGASAGITTATNTSLISAQAAGVKIYLTTYSCANTGSTASLIQFTSGSGGTVLWSTINPAGGGTNGNIYPPVPTAAATALYFTTGSGSTSQYCSVSAYAGT